MSTHMHLSFLSLYVHVLTFCLANADGDRMCACEYVFIFIRDRKYVPSIQINECLHYKWL